MKLTTYTINEISQLLSWPKLFKLCFYRSLFFTEDIDSECRRNMKENKGHLVRVKPDPATPSLQVDVLRSIQKPLVQQIPVLPQARGLQHPVNSWCNHGSQQLPFSSSEDGSSPSMVGVPSIVSSTSDDISVISSPECHQLNHVNRKRNGKC